MEEYVYGILRDTVDLPPSARLVWAMIDNQGFLPEDLVALTTQHMGRPDLNSSYLAAFGDLCQKIKPLLPSDMTRADLVDKAYWETHIPLAQDIVKVSIDELSLNGGTEYFNFLTGILWPNVLSSGFIADVLGVSVLYKARLLNHKSEDKLLACYPSFRVNDVHIVGCGGTGARLVPLVAQFMGLHYPEKTLHLWDGDTVEPKNLDRQLFVQTDLGKYKAAVLEKRYKVLHKKITSHNRNFEVQSNRSVENFSAVMVAVDSMKARHNVLSSMRAFPSQSRTKNHLVIDGGNTDSWGQVITYTATPLMTDVLAKPGALFEDNRLGLHDLGFAPAPFGLYSGPVGGTGVSCGGMEQSMAINSLIASGMFASLQNWHFENPLVASVVYFGLDGMVRNPMTINEVLKDPEDWLRTGEKLQSQL